MWQSLSSLALLLPMEQVRRQLRRMANTSRSDATPRIRPAGPVAVSLDACRGGVDRCCCSAPRCWPAPARADGGGRARRPIRQTTSCSASLSPSPNRITGAFLTYFAGQARTYGTQRIGLTSPNRRVIPMTRDYQYVAGKLGDLSRLSGDQADDAAGHPRLLHPARCRYVDYAPSVEDILALCMTGFPSFDSTSSHRRSLIYLGSGQLREPGETQAVAADRSTRSAAWRARQASRSMR